MMLYYAFRAMIANFTNVWKLLLFRLIVFVLTVSLAVALMLNTMSYLFNAINQTGIFEHIADFFTGILNGTPFQNFATIFQEDLTEVVVVLSSNFGRLALAYLYTVVILSFSRFCNGVADYAMADVLHNHMTSSAKFGFTACLLCNLKRSTCYSLWRMLFTIPFDMLIVTLLGVLLVVLFQPLGIFMPFVVMLIAILLFSFRISLFSGWLPQVVATSNKIFRSLCKSVHHVFSHFFAIYSTWAVSICAIIFIFIIGTLFTGGVGALIIIPSVMLYTLIFYQVMHYSCEGTRFYIDNETIISPKIVSDREHAVSYEMDGKLFVDHVVEPIAFLPPEERLQLDEQKKIEEKKQTIALVTQESEGQQVSVLPTKDLNNRKQVHSAQGSDVDNHDRSIHLGSEQENQPDKGIPTQINKSQVPSSKTKSKAKPTNQNKHNNKSDKE